MSLTIPLWAQGRFRVLAGRLYYTTLKGGADQPARVIRLWEEKPATGGIRGGIEQPAFEASWYEDAFFVVRPKGDRARIEQHGEKTVYVQGQNGW